MAVHVTRCPHCRTTFRVRDEHLNIANGAVRCGSCLQVFQADEHFADEHFADELLADEQSRTEQPQDHSTEQAAPEHLIHDDMDDIGGDDLLGNDVLKDDDLIHDDMDIPEDDELPDRFNDDPMTDFGIRAPEKRDRPAPRNDFEIDAAIFDLKDASSDTLDLVDPNDQALDFATQRDPDEAWADALLDDEEDSTDVGLGELELADHSDFDAPSATPHAVTDDEFSQFKAGGEADDFKGFIDDDDDMHLDGDKLDTEVIELQQPTDGIVHLREDPLELQNDRRRFTIPWGWTLASLLMLAIAATQVFYFQFDQWSRSPQWRPFYRQICEYAACQLPTVQNLKQLGTQHLVVRPHPDFQNARAVDTLLQNYADYQQPFPDLELVITDLNDGLVASRRFTPSEYLSGELAGRHLMPSHTPIRVALDIADPGAEGVNYVIHLRGNVTQPHGN